MEPENAIDVCDEMFKSKNITVHGNATIVKQNGPKLVYSVAQRTALELTSIVEDKCPIAQRGDTVRLLAIKASSARKHLTSVSTRKQEGSTKRLA